MFENFSNAEDTNQAGNLQKYKLLKEMTASERMGKFVSLFKAARTFFNAGLHSRYPNASHEEFKMRKAALLFGREYAIKRFNWDPDIEGY